jgi:hypothetical protein
MVLPCARIPCKCGDPASHAGSPASKGRGADRDRAGASRDAGTVGCSGSSRWRHRLGRPWTRWERASAILLLILAQGIFADWIAHLLLAATSVINWAELPAVGLAGSFVWG